MTSCFQFNLKFCNYTQLLWKMVASKAKHTFAVNEPWSTQSIMSLEISAFGCSESVPTYALWFSRRTTTGLTETTGKVTPTAVSTVLDTVLLL